MSLVNSWYLCLAASSKITAEMGTLRAEVLLTENSMKIYSKRSNQQSMNENKTHLSKSAYSWYPLMLVDQKAS